MRGSTSSPKALFASPKVDPYPVGFYMDCSIFAGLEIWSSAKKYQLVNRLSPVVVDAGSLLPLPPMIA